MNTKNTVIFVIGTFLLWTVAYATMIAHYPKIYSPYSFPVVIPTLLLSTIFRNESMVYAIALGTLTIPVLFTAWSYPLLLGKKQIPKRTIIVALVLVCLSAIFLFFSWSYGIQYQGYIHTLSIDFFNFCFWIILYFLYRANVKQISFSTNFMFHWMLFAWIGWCGFPWLGELL